MTDEIGQLDDADRLQQVQRIRDVRYTFYSIVPSDRAGADRGDDNRAD